jgi:AcrR family transcriptional regulator
MSVKLTHSPVGLEVPNSPSGRKRQAIVDAATEVFLSNGYLGTNMDEVAVRAGVAKQTVYNHFSDKEALFIEIVTRMTDVAGDSVHEGVSGLVEDGDVAEYLRSYAYRQLRIVLTPRLMQLRRVVIGEVNRFPQLGKCLYEGGPHRAITAFAKTLSVLADRRLIHIDNPAVAASQFNWLVMSEPLNRAMLLGDDAIPTQAALRRHAAEAVRVFLAVYGRK